MQELLLLLYANNFFSLANYIVLALLALCIFKDRGKLYIPREGGFITLTIACLSYMVLYIKNFGMPSSSSFFLRFIAPILLYYMGTVIGKDGNDRLRKCILYIGIGGFFHGFLNIVTNRNVNFLLINGRQYNDIYGGTLSGTLQSLFFVVICSLLFYFIFEEKNKWIKAGGILCVLIGLYGSITNASRTLIFLTLIVFCAGIAIYQYEKTNFVTAVARTTGIALSLAIVTMVIIWLDLFNVQEWFAGTSLGQRAIMYGSSGSSIAQNDRWIYASQIMKLLPSNLLGGMDYPHYAHNLWVDVAKEAGVIPFIFFVCFALLSIKEGIKLLVDKKMQVFDKIFFICTLLGLFMVFFTEPIMQGSPITFTIFCFVVGGVSSIIRIQKTDS